jgi:cytochrome oxidase Cu insertion factor (SCO1/SenC/PrrC family)
MKIFPPWGTLLIIFAFFLLPLLMAWFVYTGVIEFEPASTRNFGTLVEPPIPVSWTGLTLEKRSRNQGGDGEGYSVADALKGHWVILYPIQPPCEHDCLSHVTLLRQVHRAAGRNQDRVRIALVVQGRMSGKTLANLSTVYPQFTLISDPDGLLNKTLASADDAVGNRGDGTTYLVDPPGNLMMLYSTESDPHELNKDLKLLLTWSKLHKP